MNLLPRRAGVVLLLVATLAAGTIFAQPAPFNTQRPRWFENNGGAWRPQSDFNADCRIDLMDYAHAQTWRHGGCGSTALRVVWVLHGPLVDLCIGD